MPPTARALDGPSAEALDVHPEQIPAELRRAAQWVCRRYVSRGEGNKPDKQPVNPHNRGHAGVHWPNTGSNCTPASMGYLAGRSKGLRGIGFVLTELDPLVAVGRLRPRLHRRVEPQSAARCAAPGRLRENLIS